MGVLDVLLIVGLALVGVAGAVLTVFQLPGIWLILAAAIGYAWYYDWTIVGGWTVLLLVVIAALGELGELLPGMWFARKGGGSRRAGWWGLIGGVLGAFVLSLPVPIIGTIIGAAVGCFCGALAAELSLDQSAAHAGRVGLASAIGRTVGTCVKIAAALAMAGVALLSAILGSWAATG
jgi:uncharacterized protein YqgC (DUF456 family)